MIARSRARFLRESPGRTTSHYPFYGSMTTITVKHKVPNGLRTLTLATEGCALDSFDFERDGVTVLKLPQEIVEKLSVLRSLPVDEEVDMVEVKEVKDMVERWLHLKCPCAVNTS